MTNIDRVSAALGEWGFNIAKAVLPQINIPVGGKLAGLMQIMGADPATYSIWNEAKDTWQLLANSGISTMMIEWTEDETLLYLTEPIGCLIPELYLYAMTME